jgi:hypothetical protein
MSTIRLALLQLELACRLMLGAPRENGLREHIVKDLVAHATAFLDRAKDPAIREPGQDRLDVRRRHAGEVGEVGDVVRDLGAGRSDQMVEEARCDVLLLVRELGHGALEVLLDDVLRASELLESVRAQRAGAGRPLLVPDPLHDELEIRRLYPRPDFVPLDGTKASECRLDLPGSDLVQHALGQLRLDGDGRAGQLRVTLDRTQDRRSAGLPIEPVQP